MNILLLVSGDLSPLYYQTIASYRDSISEGTACNRATQARSYITFAVQYQFDPLQPSSGNLCMYIQFVKNSQLVPTTIKNYLSGTKTWLAEHGGNLAPFSSFEYQQMYAGISKRSEHVPKRAAPLTPAHIRAIVDFLDSCPSAPRAAKPCILVGYYTFLRASNLLSPSMSSWGGPHTIMTQDIQLSDTGLSVKVHSTKTKSGSPPVVTTIPWQDDPVLCPASAWMRYMTAVRPWFLGPAFLTDDARPLTARHLVGFMRLALQNYQDIIPSRISLHSLRRGATQNALQQGLSMEQIKEKGMWRSDTGVSPYLN